MCTFKPSQRNSKWIILRYVAFFRLFSIFNAKQTNSQASQAQQLWELFAVGYLSKWFAALSGQRLSKRSPLCN